MKATRACHQGLLLLGLWLPAATGLGGTYEPEYPVTKRLVALVQRAADLVGRAARASTGTRENTMAAGRRFRRTIHQMGSAKSRTSAHPDAK